METMSLNNPQTLRASNICDDLFDIKNCDINLIKIEHIIIDNVRLNIEQWQQLLSIIHRNIQSIHILVIDIPYGMPNLFD